MATLRPIEANWLNKLHRALVPFDGREFEIQGKIAITKSADGVTFAITPLERISIRKSPVGGWSVDFTINDADGHGLPWTHSGKWGHVIHTFRGYVVEKLDPLLSDRELRKVIKLIQ
jgi:hypothetical protein